MKKRALIFSILSIFTFNLYNSTEASSPTVQCQEDQACWDCSTMGNLTCGIQISSMTIERW